MDDDYRHADAGAESYPGVVTASRPATPACRDGRVEPPSCTASVQSLMLDHAPTTASHSGTHDSDSGFCMGRGGDHLGSSLAYRWADAPSVTYDDSIAAQLPTGSHHPE